MPHREGIRDYLKDLEVYGTVIDWGCGTKPIEKYLKPNKAKFFNIDKEKYDHVDFVTDIQAFDPGLPLLRCDFAFCLEVIEHLWDAKTALTNICFHLNEGGVLYFSQPYHYKTHKQDDRIRYTHHGLLQLLSEAGFTDIVVTPTVGDLEHAEGFVGSARK